MFESSIRGIRTAAVGTLMVIACVGVAAAASAGPAAHMARSIRVSERASLHLVKKSGPVLHERGSASGTLTGPVTATFTLHVIVTTGDVTIRARGGSVTLHVIGFPRSTGTVAKFGGTMKVTHGTGRYAHARGGGTFSGTVNRRTWACTVQARGRLSY
jgi:hypothetical protein